MAESLRAAFARPQGLLAGVRSVGDPSAALPVPFHLLWQRELALDLMGEPLSAAVHPAGIP
ncbi:hypothetical protein ACJ6WF_40395 [Streptomyces sp. MMS24-I2-30]|uniref:hypothetical protein n=1 Tax=Streptomyces sp. MMS24-I2-30 TaxID=3351564 RepID=UPI003896BC10